MVDPYRPPRLQLSMALIVARRAARHQPEVATRWLRMTSLAEGSSRSTTLFPETLRMWAGCPNSGQN